MNDRDKIRVLRALIYEYLCDPSTVLKAKAKAVLIKTADPDCNYCTDPDAFPLSYDGKTHWFDGAGEVDCKGA